MLRRLAGAALALTLSACAGSSMVTGEYYSAFYHPELPGHVAGAGTMPTAVYGAPFDAAGVDALLDRLRMPASFHSARFAATEAARQGRLGRTVLVFDPAPAVAGGDKACRLDEDDAVPVARGGGTRVLIAFCHGDGLASEATVRVAQAAGPTDPALTDGLNLAFARVFRATDPNKDSSCGAPC